MEGTVFMNKIVFLKVIILDVFYLAKVIFQNVYFYLDFEQSLDFRVKRCHCAASASHGSNQMSTVSTISFFKR